jgi:hypothetical protein
MTPAGSVVAVTPSSPDQRVDDERIIRAFGVGDVHARRQPEHRNRSPRAHDIDDVGAVAAVDDHESAAASPNSAADRAGEIHIGGRQVRAGEVDSRSVYPSRPACSDRAFRCHPVHHDVAPRLRVKRTRPPLAEASEISLPALPLKSILSLPPPDPRPCRCRRPDPIGTRHRPRQETRVIPLLAVDKVVVVATEQNIRAVAAQQVSSPVPPSTVI